MKINRRVGSPPSSSPVAWQGYNGINIVWPFLGPTFVDPGAASPVYNTNPYGNPTTFDLHITSAVLDGIKAQGFDYVRLMLAPGPWMEALKAPVNEARVAALFAILDPAIQAILAKGLLVDLDMHASYYVLYTPNTILSGVTSADFLLYRETIRRFAQHYASTDPKTFLLELFNEPFAAGSVVGGWDAYQALLYGDARQFMPYHTLGLTVPDWSSPASFSGASKAGFDNNTLWVLHPYRPAIFANQGYQNGYNSWTWGLTWPPNSGQKATIVAATRANIAADASLTTAQKNALTLQLTGYDSGGTHSGTGDLDYFFDIPQDKAFERSSFEFGGYVNDVLTALGWGRDRILCNEWGATRTGGAVLNGTDAASRAAYASDMADVIHGFGYRSGYMALDAADFGVTDGTDANIGAYTTALLTGIDPGRLRVVT
jgi:hypothetical protein